MAAAGYGWAGNACDRARIRPCGAVRAPLGPAGRRGRRVGWLRIHAAGGGAGRRASTAAGWMANMSWTGLVNAAVMGTGRAAQLPGAAAIEAISLYAGDD